MKCSKCKTKLKNNGSGGYEWALRLRLEGGYAEFVDDIVYSSKDKVNYPLYHILCHSCGHELTDWLVVPESVVKKWHPKIESEPLCEGWEFPHSPSESDSP